MGVAIALLGKDRKPGIVCSPLSVVGAVVAAGFFCSVLYFLRYVIFLLVFLLCSGYTPATRLGWGVGFLRVGVWGA